MLLLAAILGLQAATEQAMRGVDGVALVLDVATERVIAEWPRGREALAGAPGSAIKPFVLAAMIEQGALATSPRIACPGPLRIGGRNFACSHPKLAQAVDPVGALAYSCNNWFAAMAARLDEAALAESLRKWGFTVAGSDRQLQALGEGGVSITALGLAKAYARLGRGPRDKRITEGLKGSVAYGTSQLAASGVPLAGKTGTSKHAWFAGFAPADRPRIAVVVMVNQGAGGATAAPIAGKIVAAWGASQGLSVHSRDGAWCTIALDDYVTAAVAGEAADFPPEALKAMAVVARTYALVNRGRHSAEGFDFCDTTHCQNLDLRSRNERIRAAVDATEGELVWHQGIVAQVFYHRHCGGTTEDVASVWPALRAPYLRSRADSFCVSEGRAEWQAEVKARTLAVAGTSPSGRVTQVRLDGKLLGFEQFQRETGYAVRSAMFRLTPRAGGFLLQGYGSGHGVGLCQVGAAQRAKAGHGWRQILDFYFSGTKSGVTSTGLTWTKLGGERVDVWSTRVDAAMVRASDAALQEAERRTGWRARGRVTVRVFPTVASFRDSTGEPGWVLASTARGTIRLQPQGQAALVHEMVHAMVAERAATRLPLWFEEGLALWIESPGGPRAETLREQDLTAPESAEAMQRAYAGARGRVKSLVDRYGRAAVLSWVERGLPPEVSASKLTQATTKSR